MSAKDLISNVLAIVLVIAGAIQGYFAAIGDGEVNWLMLVLTVVSAVIAYFTGKSGDLKGSA